MTEEKAAQPLRHRWRDRVKSADGPDDHVLRLVLLVLGDWCKNDQPFSVSISVLSPQVGLKDRALRDRLNQLDGIWFTRRKCGRRYIYRLRIPRAGEVVPSLEEVRGRSNGEWEDEGVDKSPDTGTTAPLSQNAIPARPRTDTGTPAPVNTGTTAPPKRKRPKKDVERGRARPVESLARSAPDPVPVDDGDDQLEIARFIVQAIKGGNHEDFDTASELLQERRHRERQQRMSGGSG